MIDATKEDLEYAYQVLVKADAILHKNGWIKRTFVSDTGAYCILGAISCAERELGRTSLHYAERGYGLARKAIRASLPQRAAAIDYSIAGYNADDRTTFVGVIRLLSRARRLLKKAAEEK